MSQTGELPGGRVALLFTDVQGSTALLHQLGDTYGEVLDEHDRILRGAWEEFGGVEVDNEGDAFFVAFADHDRAVDAVRAAQRRLAAAAWPGGVQVKVRMALHSGEPAIRGHKYWGVDVHYAARLGSAAHGGQVLLSADMRAQVPRVDVEALGAHGLKDFPASRQIFSLVVGGGASEFPPPRTLTAVRSNLPTIDTPIIGREVVLADLRARLTGDSHLVTLVGPGGIGKTRTAIAIGEELAHEFSDGVAFVAMASLTEPASVIPAIAEAMQEELQGTDNSAALASLLRERRLLIVLDNAEHLPGLAEALASLVASAPGSRWLVTSQAPLGIRAETQIRLDALAVPSGQEDDIEAVPAAALFLERARARQPGFTVEPAEHELLAGLCRDLDGIPLALELAAARAPMLGLARLAQALGTDPDTALGHGAADLPARQRGLQAALDWTVSLLSDVEREVYATCGAFAEAWSVEDIEFMLEERAAPDQVWDALARLLDLSLVVQRGDGRFTMPERVRRHATHFLDVADEGHRRRRRHAELALHTIRRLSRERHVRFNSAMAEIEAFLPEVQHALAWSSVEDSAIYRMLLGNAGWALGWFQKEQPWLDDLIRFARAEDPGDLAQGCVWGFAATAMSGIEDMSERRRWLDAAMNRFLEFDDRAWVCEMHATLVDFERQSGDFEAAMSALAKGRAYAQSHGLVDYDRALEDYEAVLLLSAGDYVGAELLIRRWLDQPGVQNWARAGTTTYLGDCAHGQGNFRDAISWYAQHLRSTPRSDIANSLMQVYAIASSCAALGLDGLALELSAGLQRTAEVRGVRFFNAFELAGLDESLAAARLRVSAEDAELARVRGARLDYDKVIERALEVAAEVTASG